MSRREHALSDKMARMRGQINRAFDGVCVAERNLIDALKDISEAQPKLFDVSLVHAILNDLLAGFERDREVQAYVKKIARRHGIVGLIELRCIPGAIKRGEVKP